MEGRFAVTASGMKLPMTCGWTARPDTDVGAFVVTAGGLLIARRNPAGCPGNQHRFGCTCRPAPDSPYLDVQGCHPPVPDDGHPVSRDTRGYRYNRWRIPLLEA
jgi:hypothetical protein